MKKNSFLLLLIVAASAFNFSATLPDSPTRVIVDKMLKAMESYKSLQYTMRSEERLTGQSNLRGGYILTKLVESPRKTYMKMLEDPNKGTEMLYVEGERNNKAMVNPGRFLPTLNLAPTSNLLTKDQHHTMLSVGFRLVARIITAGIKRADAQGKFDEVFKYVGDVTWNGRPCYKLVIEDPTWGYTTYKAQKGETIMSIAAKLLISEYSIEELNGVKNFDEDLGGRTLKVPTSYAKKTVFYIDKANDCPVFQELSDDKGIFERYQFFNLVINPAFKADEFTKGFSEYSF